MGPEVALRESLRVWAEADQRPLVLLIDEIDSLPEQQWHSFSDIDAFA